MNFGVNNCRKQSYLRVFKVAGNSLQHFVILRFSWIIITTLYQLMLQSWYQRNAQSSVSTFFSFFMAKKVAIATIQPVGFRATLPLQQFKVALNPHYIIFLNLQNVAFYHADHNSIIKNWGHNLRREGNFKI